MYKKFQKTLVSVLFLIIALNANAKIIATDDISTISSYIDKNTLVLLDIDNTIIELAQTLGTPEWCADFYAKKRKLGMPEDEAIKITSEIFTRVNERSDAKPVDLRTSKIIQELQKQGIIVLGLTARAHVLSEATARQLKSSNVNFNVGKFKNKETNTLNGQRTQFKNGIIFAAGHNKGDCLKAFLSVTQWTPKKIVFVDDRLKHVKEVEKAIFKDNIAYTGIHYTLLNKKMKDMNPKVYEIQLEHLNKTNKILSDKDAIALLEPVSNLDNLDIGH